MAQTNVSDDPMTVARGIYEKSIRLWNEEGKTDSDPSMYTDDADLINAYGPRRHGRKEIVANTLTVVSVARPKLGYEMVSAAITQNRSLAIEWGLPRVWLIGPTLVVMRCRRRCCWSITNRIGKFDSSRAPGRSALDRGWRSRFCFAHPHGRTNVRDVGCVDHSARLLAGRV